MPVASSSRRTRRQPSEDISEEPVTQRNKVEDVDMDSGDDGARHRSSRKEKRGKGKKKAGGAAKTDEAATIDADLDVEEIQDEPFDREAFLNQPLSQKQLSKLQAFASDAERALGLYKSDVKEMTVRLAGHMAEFMRTDQAKV